MFKPDLLFNVPTSRCIVLRFKILHGGQNMKQVEFLERIGLYRPLSFS